MQRQTHCSYSSLSTSYFARFSDGNGAEYAGRLCRGDFAVNRHATRSHIVSYCPLCSSGDIHDTNLRALDDTSRQLYLVYECRSCTGRFVADRPEHIEKVENETADAFASPERVAQQRAHFTWKRIFDENDYPYSLIPLIERWSP